ncbi:MAG TPA: hypothetical protein VHU82_05785 [Vicinamibacterales bacterium]|jgi:hypothetical protein|nr:hypothetical protein [Vicinamibacterales bacterium]
MARQLEFGGRRYWIFSEPQGDGWRSTVVEVADIDGRRPDALGIDAAADTRVAADDAAERKLRRLVRAGRRTSP